MTHTRWPLATARACELALGFEQLSAERLGDVAHWYAVGARFKDPFQDVTGTDAITAIYADMFERLNDPRFVVLSLVSAHNEVFLTWDLHFSAPMLGKGPQRIHGATHWQLNDAGQIAVHRDYWDAAEELYAKVPVLGWLMRALRRRVSAGSRPRA